jgi:secondary thiamine-phosphate synthase enzyme
MGKGTFSISTSQRLEFVDITAQLEKEISRSGSKEGTVCHVYNPHTTAGLTINEGADPAVQEDILSVLRKVIPANHPYRHLEGNSPAHIMASLMGSSVTIFVEKGRLQLGTWQRIFFCEFDGPRTRKVHWRLV